MASRISVGKGDNGCTLLDCDKLAGMRRIYADESGKQDELGSSLLLVTPQVQKQRPQT